MITEEVLIAEEKPEVPVEISLPEIKSTTQRNIVPDSAPITPIDVIENIKLESYVNKTIVNDNNVVDVPVYQAKDKMLEEVKKMISDPPVESTTATADVSIETTTLQPLPETTTETTTVKSSEATKPYTTVTVATHSALETETIFVPIMTNNNENIENYDEKVSVIATTDNSQRVSVWTDFVIGSETTRCLQLSVDVLLIFMISISCFKAENDFD